MNVGAYPPCSHMATPESRAPSTEHTEAFFLARDGVRLFRQHWPAKTTSPRATIAFVHGYSDHSGRYGHLFEALVDHGYEVHAFDYRGHGRSGGRRGHVDRFEEYLHDLEDFLAEVEPSFAAEKRFVVAHSNGGLIVTRWLLDRPEGFAGFVLSSPFYRLGFKPPALKVFASRLIGTVVPFLPVSNELKPEQLTSDPEFQEKTKNDPLYNHVTTPRWFSETLAAQEEVILRASEITAPILVMQAGADPIVDVETTRRVFEAFTSRDKTYVEFDGFRHELFMEAERDRPIETMLRWIDERL